MISQSRARTLSLPALAIAGIAAFCLTVTPAKADQWDKKTILTIDQPVQVRNTYLQPGTYVLKLMDSPSDRHVVQIFNKDQSRIIDTVMAIPNYRLQPTGKSQFAFWETPPGKAKAMRAWFYPGDNFGQEFPYPKYLRDSEVASVVTHTYAPPANANAVEDDATIAEETPAPAAVTPAPSNDTAATTNEPATNEAEAEAQAAEPQAPPQLAAATPEPAPAPVTAQTQPSTELPKTASPYPLMGGLGLLSLASWAVLRRKRSV